MYKNCKNEIESIEYGAELAEVEVETNLLKLDNIVNVSPYKSVSSTVSRLGTKSQRANIIATTPSYLDTLGLTISAGRLMSEIDIRLQIYSIFDKYQNIY